MAIRTITVPVKDLEAATALYTTLLGVDPYMASPYYVGFRPEGSPEVGLNPHGDLSAAHPPRRSMLERAGQGLAPGLCAIEGATEQVHGAAGEGRDKRAVRSAHLGDRPGRPVAAQHHDEVGARVEGGAHHALGAARREVVDAVFEAELGEQRLEFARRLGTHAAGGRVHQGVDASDRDRGLVGKP